MKSDWSEYLEFAQDLVQQASSSSLHQEAMLRSAISRAYYCAYHSARHFIDQQGARTASYYNSHEGVIRWYGEQPGKEYRAVSTRLERVKDDRVRADYKRGFTPNLSLANKTLREVDAILDIIHHLP